MSAMPALGILLAIVVDIALPAVLLWRWARLNRQHAESVQSDRNFWRAAAVYGCCMALWVRLAIARTFSYEGTFTLSAVFFTLPLSAVPAIFNSNAIHYFFTVQEWADFGYLVVLPVFLVGILLWALLLPVAIRRFSQWLVRPRYTPDPAPQFLPSDG